MFHALGVALCWCLSRLVASTECKIGLVYYLAVERRLDDICRSFRALYSLDCAEYDFS